MKQLYKAQSTAAPTAFAWAFGGATATQSDIRCESRGIGNVRVIAGALSFFILLIAVCIGEVIAQPPHYWVRDTGHGFAVLPSTIQQIFWLDNDRILYSGYESAIRETRKNDGESVLKRGIYILNIRNNRLNRHADAEGFLCYRNGFVRYLVSFDVQTRVSVRREGKFGEEKESVADMKERPRGQLVNPLTCNDYDATGNATKVGKRLPLLDDHGVLEYARSGPEAGSPMYPARLFARDGSEPITLPLSGAAVSAERVRYYEFADTYTVGYQPPKGPSTQWPKNAVHFIYLMNPKGDVTEVPISGGAWSDIPVHRFVLSKAGIVLYGGKLRKYLDPGTTGVYLVQGVRTVKLVSGLLRGIGVSPSGCSVAVAMTSYSKVPDPTTIRIIEFCGKEGSK